MHHRLLCQIGVWPVLLVLAAISGCSIKADGLVPEDIATATTVIPKTVQVMPVTGGRASRFGREAYITNEQYHEALTDTLQQAGLFSEILEQGPADLNLHSEIITISTESGLSPTFAIVVQYWITDPETDEEIWRRGFNTRHEVKFGEALAGATRIIRAVEGATQKNLTRLVEALGEADL